MHKAVRPASTILAIALTGLTSYSIGRADAAPVHIHTPQPVAHSCRPTAQQCMPVWFQGQPGDMQHARKRACPRGK